MEDFVLGGRGGDPAMNRCGWLGDDPEELGFVGRGWELIGALLVVLRSDSDDRIETHVMAVRFYFGAASR
jgi:hypothetical protein